MCNLLDFEWIQGCILRVVKHQRPAFDAAVYVRWYLWKMGKNKGKLYLYNGLTMVVVFFLCRPLLGTGAIRRISLPSFLRAMSPVELHVLRNLEVNLESDKPLDCLSHVNRLLA